MKNPVKPEEQQTPEQLAEVMNGREVRFRFVRHGQTVYNTEHRMQGWSDSPMTPLGDEQIAMVGQALKRVPIELVFSSDLQRCRTTTQGILDARAEHPQPVFLEELREWNFGGHEAQLSKHVWGKLIEKHNIEFDREADAIRQLGEKLGWTGMFDGVAELDETGQSEYAAQIVLRADRALTAMLSAAAAEPGDELVNVLVVTHGGFISTLLRQLIPEVSADSILPNCSVSTVELRDGAWQLIAQGVEPQDFAA